MPPRLTADAFAARLHGLLEAREVSQSQLAQRMGISRSTVTGWLHYGKLPDAAMLVDLCVALGCSADSLLGMEPEGERQTPDGTAHWIERLPDPLPDPLRDSLREGARLFRVLLSGALPDDYPLPNAQATRALLQAALRSGAVQLTAVGRDEPLENAVYARYPSLKQVVVAQIPQGCAHPIVRTELVAFLAAHEVLTQVVRPRTCGLGSGYTILRLCENSIPTDDQFSGTAWVPLVAFRHEHSADYTANYLAKFMSIRHANSRALALPHPDHAGSSLYAGQLDECNRAMRDLQAVFLSVSGVEQRTRRDIPHLLGEFRSADFAADAADLRAAYATIDSPDEFGAEVLRCLIDRQGQVLARDSATGNQPDLAVLRYSKAMSGTVCIVAASNSKAGAVRLCAGIGLANALVIDSEIARRIVQA